MFSSGIKLICHWAIAFLVFTISARCIAADATALPPIELPSVGTTVTGSVQNEPAGDAFDKFAQATHTKLLPEGLFTHNRFNNVTADFKETPYWDAVTQLCTQTGLFPMGTWDERLVLGADAEAWVKQPHLIKGPFRVAVAKTEHGKAPIEPPRRGRAAAAAADLAYWNVRITIESEPSVHARGAHLSKIQVDDRGHPIPQKLPPADLYYGFNSGRATINLPVGVADKVTKIDVKGTVEVLVATRIEPFVIEDIDQTPTLTKTVDKLKYEISIKPAGGGSDVQMKISAAAPMNVNDWKKLRSVSYENLRIFDANDIPFAFAGGGNSFVKGNPTATIMMPQFRNAPGQTNPPKGPPKKFRWEVTTAYKEIEVPFEFKDVPLHDPKD